MLLRNKNPLSIISAGVICAALSVILGRFAGDWSGVDFMQGVFAGMSIPLNIYGLYLFGRQRRAG
jgi:hypothetical protein